MTTKTTNKTGKKTRKKLDLKKETLRDLSPGNNAGAIRGGANKPNEVQAEMGSQAGCFGTLA